MHCKQRKAIIPQKGRIGPSHFSACPSSLHPPSFAGVAGPRGAHIMPSLQLELPISRPQHFKCHQSALQGFHSTDWMHCKQKKAINPPKRQTFPSQFSECPSPMVRIHFAVTAAPSGPHIMPSHQLELPISTSQHFKCHHSALRGFSLYHLDALQAKKGHKPPKASNLSLTVLRVPLPNGPDSFCSGSRVLWGTHNALAST